MPGTITGANSVFTLIIPGLYPQGVQLQGYSSERAWQSEAQQTSESMMGVDGQKASGWTPAIVPQTVTLLANSASRAVFSNLKRLQEANRDVVVMQGSIDLPSTGESYVCTNGTVKNLKALPDFAKVLMPVDIVIEWQNISPSLT